MRPRLVSPLVLALLAAVAFASAAGAASPAGVGRPGSVAARRGAAAPATATPAGKPEQGSLTMLYGDDHVFGIVPPQGWVVDDSSGLSSKIRVVLYPRGQKWSTAPTVIYSNPLHQDPREHKTLAQMIDRTIADFHKHSPRGKVVNAPPVFNPQQRRAEMRYFSPNGGDPLTAIAYYEEQSMVMLLVLESKTAAGFRSALPGFNGMVGSYQFVASTAQQQANPGRRR